LVGGSNAGGGVIFLRRSDRRWGLPTFLYRVSFPRSKRPGRVVDHSRPIWLRGSRNSRAILLLPLCVFMACYRVNFIPFSLHLSILKDRLYEQGLLEGIGLFCYTIAHVG